MSDTAYPVFQHYGTAAARAAFTPAPAGGTQPIYIWYETDTNNFYIYTTAWKGPYATGGSGTVTNTGALTANALVIGNGGVDVSTTTTGTGILTFLGTPSSANLAAALTDETGTGAAVFATSPTLVTPALGTPASGTLSAAINGSVAAYLCYQDQKAQNTDGGTFTSGAWQTRVLNTEVSDVGGYGTLASNQVTLASGTYIARASGQAYFVNRHQMRLQNVTDATTLLTGISMYAPAADYPVSVAWVSGLFTVGASKAIELQHQCQTTHNTNGWGVASNFTTEVYAVLELWKIG